MKTSNIKKLISYYQPYRGLFFADLGFAIVGSGVTLVIPLIVRFITEQVVILEAQAAFSMIIKLGAFMMGLVALECICNIFITYYGHMVGANIEADMRKEIFGHYQKLSFAFYDNQKVGYLLSRITSDLFDISELLHHGPEDVIISIIKFIGSFVILFQVNRNMTFVAFAFIPILFLYAFSLNKKMKKAFWKNREKIAALNSQIEDNLSGIRVVKSFANEEMELKKFHKGNNKFVDAKRESYRYMAAYHSGLTALITMVTIGVLVAGAWNILERKLVVADLVTFLLYINNFTEPIKKLVALTEQFQNGYAGFERFEEILSIEPDIQDKDNAINPGRLKGQITFREVSFCYENDKEKVLNHLNLEVEEGDYLAIVGSSGAGKTTMCSLIPRFYDVTGGQIQIDGIDIRDMELKSLRENIGIVQQDVYLFAGTILENIRYGRLDASDREVIEAARRANAHDFIVGFPEGYATDIGQRGVKLSGGQKQRLSIARVFLKNPSILIFDEATSALDNESERVVQKSLEELAKGRTTFVIAHRLSTIRNAKKIVVLTEDGIQEQGSHEELLKKKGIYKHLYEMQFEGPK